MMSNAIGLIHPVCTLFLCRISCHLALSTGEIVNKLVQYSRNFLVLRVVLRVLSDVRESVASGTRYYEPGHTALAASSSKQL